MAVLTILGVIEVALIIGMSVYDATERYNGVKDKYKPKAYIQIDNFYNSSLAQLISYTKKGATNNLPEVVAPGFREAQFIEQNVLFKGVEMLASYGLSGGIRVFYYIRVDHKSVFRESNKMGVAIRRKAIDEPTEDWFNKIVDDSTLLGITEFKKSSKTLQCCLDDICVQGSMTSTVHANMTLRVMPRKIEMLGTEAMKDTVYGRQTDLDHFLDNPKSCWKTNNALSILPALGSSGFNALVAMLFVHMLIV